MSPLSLKWIFILDEDRRLNVRAHLDMAKIPPEGLGFDDRSGKRRLEIHANGDAVVLARYAWDGCTPKFSLFDIVFGIPDGVPNVHTTKPKAYYASLFHDAFYQFLDAGLPMKRVGADRVFLEILTEHGFRPRWIYYAAVRAFGGMARHVTGRKRKYAGTKYALPALSELDLAMSISGRSLREDSGIDGS